MLRKEKDMKRTLFFIWALVFFSSHVMSQGTIPSNNSIDSDFEREIIRQMLDGNDIDPFMLQLSVNYQNDNSPVEWKAQFSEYVAEMTKKRDKGMDEDMFITQLYYKTHKKFLKNYRNYSSFSHMLETGNYDCLSATIMYALLLNEFDIKFEVVETDYHIYLIAEYENGRIMLETTDPVNGLITKEDDIIERIDEINTRNQSLSEGYLTLQTDRNFMSLVRLTGLQYFNASVAALNEGEIISAIDQLEKARIYDDAERFREYGKHLARVLVYDQSLSEETRQQYLLKLTQFLNNGVITAAL